MIEKIVRKRPLHDPSAQADDLAYWLSKTPEERLSAVEILRRQEYGEMGQMQRVVRIIRRKRD